MRIIAASSVFSTLVGLSDASRIMHIYLAGQIPAVVINKVVIMQKARTPCPNHSEEGVFRITLYHQGVLTPRDHPNDPADAKPPTGHSASKRSVTRSLMKDGILDSAKPASM